MNEGFAIHCHHNVLVEYCYSYNGRAETIKITKPLIEQEIRLRLFRMLPEEALKDIPIRLQKAEVEWVKADVKRDKAYVEWKKTDVELKKTNAEWKKANDKRDKAGAEWRKTDADWQKAHVEWKKAEAELSKASAEWLKADQDAFHKKWCGCEEWNGEEIVFKKD